MKEKLFCFTVFSLNQSRAQVAAKFWCVSICRPTNGQSEKTNRPKDACFLAPAQILPSQHCTDDAANDDDDDDDKAAHVHASPQHM